MSESIRRRSSSRQVLQNLIRVTAQRSQEDAEEVERERRRRAREKQRVEGRPSWPEPPPHNTGLDEELKPSCLLVLEEDEGFSDWTHRLENRHEQEAQDNCRASEQRPSAPQWAEPEDQEDKEEVGQEAEQSSQSQEPSASPPEKMSSIRKDARPSYSLSVFLPQDARLQRATGQPADRMSYLVAGTLRPPGRVCRVDGEVERSKEEEEVQHTLRAEDDLEEEELSFICEERDDFQLGREQRHREEEEEQHKTPHQRSVESRAWRSEEVNRRAADSLCNSSDSEELVNCYGPMSPTFKKLLIQFYPDEVNRRVSTDGKCTITERTESLRKCTNTMKKTPSPVAVSKIDKKLEQYTHALEVSSKESRPVCQVLTDAMSPTEPVASKKSLFEAGEAWSQNPVPVTPSKDADGLKVGVADLINQWVRGSEDGSGCSSPTIPAEIKPGGVLNKKNLWESLGDTVSSGREGKETSSGKRHKFVVTGHGKYEKVSVDSSDDINCQSAGLFYEDL
uniref:caldesmon, smooth muscle-like n=1 Tax=Monopterus albus TaxID=43700 RepID=UPI0009B4EA49|nr:caldesmon, smooth muscle-like [Monopterus albus]